MATLKHHGIRCIGPFMPTKKSRITPVPMAEWGEEERDALSVFIKDDGKRLKTDKKERSDQDMIAINYMLKHPALAKATFPLSRHLLYDGLISARDRELIILRVAWTFKAEFEWAQHVVVGQLATITDEEVYRVSQGADSPNWPPKEKLLMTATDELLKDACITDVTWTGLTRFYSEKEIMELISTVGCYTTAAMTFNSLGIPAGSEMQAVLDKFPLTR
jgi:4-carboxymuconolactone decarboxylase